MAGDFDPACDCEVCQETRLFMQEREDRRLLVQETFEDWLDATMRQLTGVERAPDDRWSWWPFEA